MVTGMLLAALMAATTPAATAVVAAENFPGRPVVARSNPDGYTIALIGQPHLTATLLAKDPPWDPFKDFAHIGMVATMPNIVTVPPPQPSPVKGEVLMLSI